jgi:hypothetical protein
MLNNILNVVASEMFVLLMKAVSGRTCEGLVYETVIGS